MKSNLEDGLLRDGVRREMKVDGIDELMVLEGYTLMESAEALGKAYLTVRGWIQNGIIPEPVCQEAVTGYRQFLRFELEGLAAVLSVHEQTSRYVSSANTQLVDTIHQTIEDLRAAFFEQQGVTAD